MGKMFKCMTKAETRRALCVCKSKYIVMVKYNNYRYAFNVQYLLLKLKNKPIKMNQETIWIGYYACNLNEYINRKVPFQNIKLA